MESRISAHLAVALHAVTLPVPIYLVIRFGRRCYHRRSGARTNLFAWLLILLAQLAHFGYALAVTTDDVVSGDLYDGFTRAAFDYRAGSVLRVAGDVLETLALPVYPALLVGAVADICGLSVRRSKIAAGTLLAALALLQAATEIAEFAIKVGYFTDPSWTTLTASARYLIDEFAHPLFLGVFVSLLALGLASLMFVLRFSLNFKGEARSIYFGVSSLKLFRRRKRTARGMVAKVRALFTSLAAVGVEKLDDSSDKDAVDGAEKQFEITMFRLRLFTGYASLAFAVAVAAIASVYQLPHIMFNSVGWVCVRIMEVCFTYSVEAVRDLDTAWVSLVIFVAGIPVCIYFLSDFAKQLARRPDSKTRVNVFVWIIFTSAQLVHTTYACLAITTEQCNGVPSNHSGNDLGSCPISLTKNVGVLLETAGIPVYPAAILAMAGQFNHSRPAMKRFRKFVLYLTGLATLAQVVATSWQTALIHFGFEILAAEALIINTVTITYFFLVSAVALWAVGYIVVLLAMAGGGSIGGPGRKRGQLASMNMRELFKRRKTLLPVESPSLQETTTDSYVTASNATASAVSIHGPSGAAQSGATHSGTSAAANGSAAMLSTPTSPARATSSFTSLKSRLPGHRPHSTSAPSPADRYRIAIRRLWIYTVTTVVLVIITAILSLGTDQLTVVLLNAIGWTFARVITANFFLSMRELKRIMKLRRQLPNADAGTLATEWAPPTIGRRDVNGTLQLGLTLKKTGSEGADLGSGKRRETMLTGERLAATDIDDGSWERRRTTIGFSGVPRPGVARSEEAVLTPRI
ncbi:hypothetical protein H9P43_000433 [Blastocladiella emersonii ATCC 22665]|nr:hypothetical protein H9P43_000433 [Blastocladiella emersonii ATCC 22665]